MKQPSRACRSAGCVSHSWAMLVGMSIWQQGACLSPSSSSADWSLRSIARPRWFEEDLALFGNIRQAIESRYAIEQELNLVVARTPNPFYRPLAKKVSPTEARKDQV